MEHIRKAMKLARLERLSPAANESAEDTVTFSRSRVVPVDPLIMARHQLLQPGAVGAVSQSMKMLRTQILQRMQQRGWNTLAVVSPTSDDGKTFTAINLAIAIAGHEGLTALLVDLDLRRPSVHGRFGFEPEYGVAQCLRGECSIADALVNPVGYDRLLVLPGKECVEHSSELLARERSRRAIGEIKARYPNRIVIYDLPPLLGADDALAFLPQVDAALMVIGEERTRREDVLRSFELTREFPVLGTVLNGSRSSSPARYSY
jgi:Mrp family chromosome partitioning ATPase